MRAHRTGPRPGPMRPATVTGSSDLEDVGGGGPVGWVRVEHPVHQVGLRVGLVRAWGLGGLCGPVMDPSRELKCLLRLLCTVYIAIVHHNSQYMFCKAVRYGRTQDPMLDPSAA